MSVAANTLRILTVERYGETFNQQVQKLSYTPRRSALLKNANCLVIIEVLVVDNLLVRIHFIIVMIRWTGLAPWEFEFRLPGSFTSTFLSSSARQLNQSCGS